MSNDLPEKFEKKITSAQTREELKSVVEELKDLKVQNKLKPSYSAGITGLIISLAGCSAIWPFYSAEAGTFLKLGLVIASGGVIGSAASMLRKSDRFSNIASLIYKKDALFDNNVKEKEVDGIKKFHELAAIFEEFRNKNTKIDSWYESTNPNFPLEAFEYKFQTVYHVGKSREIQTFQRYGFITKLNLNHDIAIHTHESGEYKVLSRLQKSAYSLFNNKYQMYSNQDSPLNKNEDFLDLYTNLKGFDDMRLEIKEGLMCLSFSNDPFKIRSILDINQPDIFEEKMKGKTEIPRLEDFKEFYEALIKLKVIKDNYSNNKVNNKH